MHLAAGWLLDPDPYLSYFYFPIKSSKSIRSHSFIWLLLPLVIMALPAFSQDQARRTIGKLNGAVVFDGKPDEGAWEDLETFPMISHMPVYGNPPSEQSLIRMGYDENFVYVGGLLYVSDPSFIQAVGKKRDMETMSSDFFMISIDTYNDKENSQHP